MSCPERPQWMTNARELWQTTNKAALDLGSYLKEASSFLEDVIFLDSNLLNELFHPTQIHLQKRNLRTWIFPWSQSNAANKNYDDLQPVWTIRMRNQAPTCVNYTLNLTLMELTIISFRDLRWVWRKKNSYLTIFSQVATHWCEVLLVDCH